MSNMDRSASAAPLQHGDMQTVTSTTSTVDINKPKQRLCWHRRAGLALLCATSLLASCSNGNGGQGSAHMPKVPSQDVAVLESYLKSGLQLEQQRNTVINTGVLLPAEADSGGNAAGNFGDVEFGTSSTNVQVQNVDEMDWVKNNGSLLFSFVTDLGGLDKLAGLEGFDAVPPYSQGVVIHAMQSGNTPSSTAVGFISLDANTFSMEGFYLAGPQRDQVVSVGRYYDYQYPDYFAQTDVMFCGTWAKSYAALQINDASDPSGGSPVTLEARIDGDLVTSRLINNHLYLVTRSYPPYEFIHPLPFLADPDTDIAPQEQDIDSLKLEDLLPKITLNGVEQTLVSADDCYVPETELDESKVYHYPTLVTVSVFDMDEPGKFESTCIATYPQTIYANTDNIYITAAKGQNHTTIYRLSIDGSQVSYRGYGEVIGGLSWDSPFRLDEYAGHLRILTTDYEDTNGTWFNFNPVHRISTLRLDDNQLEPLVTIPNEARPEVIGKPGEDVFGVRFIRDRAYIVTFRRTDPFYVVDLSNPQDPAVLGELTLPGFSEYLHPVSDKLILGLGRDGDQNGQTSGLKLVLFDVSDPSSPQIYDQRLLSDNAYSPALHDHRALTLLPSNDDDSLRIALPYETYTALSYFNSVKVELLSISGLNDGGNIAFETAGSMLIDTPYLSYTGRAVLQNNAVHFAQFGQVWSANWSTPEQISSN